MKIINQINRVVTQTILTVALAVGSLAALKSEAQIFAKPPQPDTASIPLGFSKLTASTVSNVAQGTITSYTNVTTAYSPSTATMVNTTNITSVTNTPDGVVFLSLGQSSLPLMFVQQANAASTANSQTLWQRSGDGVKWDNTAAFSILVPQQGTTEAVFLTNPPTLGFPYIRMLWGSNAHATVDVTNFYVKRVGNANAP